MTDVNNPCVFCEIVAGRAPATVYAESRRAIAIAPIGPVQAGHTLLIPKRHSTDWTDAHPDDLKSCLSLARRVARKFRFHQSNLITSAGRAATQTVFHTHVHLVPRFSDDQIPVPWGWNHNLRGHRDDPRRRR